MARPCSCGRCATCALYDNDPDARAWYEAEAAGDVAALAAVAARVRARHAPADPYAAHTGPHSPAPDCPGCRGEE